MILAINNLLRERVVPEEMIKRLNGTSKPIRDTLDDQVIISLFYRVADNYFIDPNDVQELSILITLYILKYISAQEFADYSAAMVKPNQWPAFAKAMEDKFWSLYESVFEKEGIVWKQISLLEPQPLPQDEEISPEPVQTDTQQQATIIANTVSMVDNKPAPQPAPTPIIPSIKQSEPIAAPATQPPPPQATPPELIVIGGSPEKTEPIVPQKPPTPPPAFNPNPTPRIRVGDSKISQQAPAINVPQPPKPVFMGVQFEAVIPKPENQTEIKGTTEKKDIQVPAAPVIPKANIQGKEVIDLTTFTLQTGEKKGE